MHAILVIAFAATAQLPAPGLLARAHPTAAWEPVTEQTALETGTEVQASTGDAVLTLSDGARLQLQRGTSLQLQAPLELNLDLGRKTRVARIDLKKGALRVEVPEGSRPILVMASPQIFAAVRPGSARVRITPQGMVVAIDTGAAKVASAGRFTSLAAGSYQYLRFHGQQPGPQPLPPKPSFSREPCQATASNPCAIGLVTGEGKAPLQVRWSPAASKLRVIAEVRRESDGALVEKHEQAGDRGVLRTDPLGVGAYRVSLRGVTADGVEGPSAERALRVVRLLPELGVSWLPEQHTLVFAPGRKAMLDGASGVELSWLGADFGPPPPCLQLVKEPVRTARLRVQGDSTDEAVLRMERRELHAAVELQPQTARWPRDPIQIRVQVSDARGRIDCARLLVSARVTVNSTPVQVGLVRREDGWHGQLPPRNGHGPWAVRVEALDENGDVLGHGAVTVLSN